MSKWKIAIIVALFSLVVSYVLAYWQLSRRGMVEAREFGTPGFVYGARDRNGDYDQTFHVACAIVFAPINAIDQFFGGMGPLSGGTRGLS